LQLIHLNICFIYKIKYVKVLTYSKQKIGVKIKNFLKKPEKTKKSSKSDRKSQKIKKKSTF